MRCRPLRRQECGACTCRSGTPIPRLPGVRRNTRGSGAPSRGTERPRRNSLRRCFLDARRTADNPLVAGAGSRANEEVDRHRAGRGHAHRDRGAALASLVLPLLGLRYRRVPLDPASARPRRTRLDPVLRLGRDVSVLPWDVLRSSRSGRPQRPRRADDDQPARPRPRRARGPPDVPHRSSDDRRRSFRPLRGRVPRRRNPGRIYDGAYGAGNRRGAPRRRGPPLFRASSDGRSSNGAAPPRHGDAHRDAPPLSLLLSHHGPGDDRCRRARASAAGAILIIGVVSVVVGVPGTTFQVPASGLLYFVPLVLLLSFSSSGRPFGDFLADGLQVNGWLVALLGSAVVGIVAAPRVLIPYRHTEYLMIPLAIFAGIGFFRLLDLAGLRGGKRTLALGVCGLLLAANAVAGIPPPSTLAGWREGTIPAALDPAYWARDYASGLVVSDHQGSTTVFGFGGLNATWDRTRAPFLPDSLANPFAGLVGIDSPSGRKNGTYIWIDRDMEAGVRLTPWETAAPMNTTVIERFDASPFVKVFDNGYARLYWIAWGCTPSTC